MTSDLYSFVKYYNETDPKELKVIFDKGTPYEPLKQLICILHPANANLLPPIMADLISSKSSPLRSPIDLYPDEFKIDPYGAIFDHEHIAILPFIEEEFINKVYSTIDFSKFTQEELERN